MKKILRLALIDFKLIFRDPSLRTFLFFPIVLLGLIIWALPALVMKYDLLTPYIPIFLVVAVIENTQMFCFISSMVLIDEKESDVAKVYGVVPFTKWQFIVSRFLIPYFFTTLLNFILFYIQPFYTVSFISNLAISLLTALIVPIYVLSINTIVKNRMQGMVYIKGFNMLVLIPIVAFFVPEKFKHFFGFFPTHWIFQSVENLTKGISIVTMSTIGFLFLGVLLFFVSKQFIKKHFI
jgi:fluoroquinolone transport system permease protein